MIEIDENDPHPRCPDCGCFMKVIRNTDLNRLVFTEWHCNNTRYDHGDYESEYH